jgi:hypothetical protein
MPTNGIHLLLSLEDLLNLFAALVRNPVFAFILAPEVFGDLAGPVNTSSKRFGKLGEVVKGAGYGICVRRRTPLPAIESSAA